jgi:hypothetical protein
MRFVMSSLAQQTHRGRPKQLDDQHKHNIDEPQETCPGVVVKLPNRISLRPTTYQDRPLKWLLE